MYFSHITSKIHETFAEQRFYLFEWAVVFFGLGIAGYFALSNEPPFWMVSLVGLVGVALGFWSALKNPSWAWTLLLAALVFGFTNAALQTQRHAPEHHWTTTELTRISALEGTIQSIEHRPRNLRLKIRPDHLEGTEGTPLPKNWPLRAVRVTTPLPQTPLRVRDHIRVSNVTLSPPSKPLTPGGYDFSRHCFFEGIEAVGFADTPPLMKDHPPCHGLGCAQESLEGLREGIRTTFEAGLSRETAGIAKALVTGDRGGISKATQRLFSEVGIAHILAISGLHFSLVTAFLFIGIRLILVAIPGIAERYPIKQWAGAAALLGAATYLFLSGMAIPTLRAFIMISCVMVGLFLYRQTISLRLVMIAAFLILLWMPDALLSPSFELSFAAVIALISAYRHHLEHRTLTPGRFKKIGAYIWGLLYTSAVAWIATTPIALSFFQVLSPYALLANLWVVPWMGCVVMPLALLSVLAIPLGLEGPILWLFEISLQLLIQGTEWMHTLPFASARLSAPPPLFLACWLSGGLWICLFQGRGRWLGLLPIAMGGWLWLHAQAPDFYIDQDPALMAVRHRCAAPHEGAHCLSFPRKAYGGFVQNLWKDHAGADAIHLWPYPPRENTPDSTISGGPLTCNRLGCTLQKGDLLLTFPRSCRILERHLQEDAARQPKTIWVNRWPNCTPQSHPQMFSLFENSVPIGPGAGILIQTDGKAVLAFEKTQTQHRPWIRG